MKLAVSGGLALSRMISPTGGHRKPSTADTWAPGKLADLFNENCVTND
jgi:hypothetical protein